MLVKKEKHIIPNDGLMVIYRGTKLKHLKQRKDHNNTNKKKQPPGDSIRGFFYAIN